MFQVLSRANSATVSLNDNAGFIPPEQVVTGRDAKSIAWAVYAYAKRNRIAADRVGYSVSVEA